MQNKIKKIFNNSLTVFLVLGTLFGLYLLSVFAIFGIMLTLMPEPFSSRQILPTASPISKVIMISIVTIILLPLLRIIRQSAGKRWEITKSVTLLFWPYLVFSFILYYLSVFLVTQWSWFAVVGPNKEPHLFISGLFVSIVLASTYFWYVKKINTLLLKK